MALRAQKRFVWMLSGDIVMEVVSIALSTFNLYVWPANCIDSVGLPTWLALCQFWCSSCFWA